jgi:hypothetical protein
MMGLFRSTGLSQKLKGNGYWILNVLRAGNIVALFSVMAACVVMMAFSIINKRAWGFDILSYAMIVLFTSFLAYSETGLSKAFFTRHWPILASEIHGFGWLGLFLIFLGFFVLGNLNEEAFLQENIPLAIWRLILASGILSLTFGVLALVSTVIFNDSRGGITARAVRESGCIAQPTPSVNNKAEFDAATTYSQSSHVKYGLDKPESHFDDGPQSRAQRLAARAKRVTAQFTPQFLRAGGNSDSNNRHHGWDFPAPPPPSDNTHPAQRGYPERDDDRTVVGDFPIKPSRLQEPPPSDHPSNHSSGSGSGPAEPEPSYGGGRGRLHRTYSVASNVSRFDDGSQYRYHGYDSNNKI